MILLSCTPRDGPLIQFQFIPYGPLGVASDGRSPAEPEVRSSFAPFLIHKTAPVSAKAMPVRTSSASPLALSPRLCYYIYICCIFFSITFQAMCSASSLCPNSALPKWCICINLSSRIRTAKTLIPSTLLSKVFIPSVTPLTRADWSQ